MEGIFSNEFQVHLLPCTPQNYRNWHIGFESDNITNDSIAQIKLDVRPHTWQNFSSFLCVLEQIKQFCTKIEDENLLDSLIQDIASKNGASNLTESHSDFLTHAVTHSIMRRISRESVFTSSIIDKGAKLINRVLSRIDRIKKIHIPNVDYLDRLSLKVFIRAILIQKESESFEWHWYFTSNVLDQSIDSTKSILRYSRHLFFQKALRICIPNVVFDGKVKQFQFYEKPVKNITHIDISHALVMQNYDACIVWSKRILRIMDQETDAEIMRLRGIAAVNIGLIEEAMSCFAEAETKTKRLGKKAHIAYLQGLVKAKRNYNLSESESHYDRGLSYLESNSDFYPDDPLLERAWLLNGKAMNQALLGKQFSNSGNQYEKAFFFVVKAFKLIIKSNKNPAIYLRYNLIANTAFLFEIQKKYSLAIKIFKEVFDIQVDKSTFQGKSWEITLGYRLACLHLKNHEYIEAHIILKRLEALESLKDNPHFHERILRALGFSLLALSQYEHAEHIYKRGLEICRRERSAEGAKEHFKGLSCSLLGQEKSELFWTLRSTLETEELIFLNFVDDHVEEIKLLELLKPNYPSPKLPAYLPEIDLEDVPDIDLNKYLGNIGDAKKILN